MRKKKKKKIHQTNKQTTARAPAASMLAVCSQTTAFIHWGFFFSVHPAMRNRTVDRRTLWTRRKEAGPGRLRRASRRRRLQPKAAPLSSLALSLSLSLGGTDGGGGKQRLPLKSGGAPLTSSKVRHASWGIPVCLPPPSCCQRSLSFLRCQPAKLPDRRAE